MVAAFSGFVAGSVVGLQQFGLGLAVAIFVDATLVRALLVPALMAVFGRWNWWLPARLARRAYARPRRRARLSRECDLRSTCVPFRRVQGLFLDVAVGDASRLERVRDSSSTG